MIASHHAGEITFYEEIGVAPGASPEEIRNAFRALVRLFHPDQQTDPQLKEIAEKQMRKLNRVYAVLSDPERRRRYDEVLEREYISSTVVVGPVFKSGLRQFMGRTASFAAILLGAGLLIWLTPESIPGPQSFARDQTAPPRYVPPSLSAVEGDQGSLITSLRSELRAVTLERGIAIRELNRLQGAAPESQSGISTPPDGAEVAAGSPVTTMTELPSGTAEKRPVRGLAGFWFYAKTPQAQSGKFSTSGNDEIIYQPDRIEATIWKRKGRIYGKYRARFRIADRGISPDVSFAFTGTPGAGPQFTFPWTGAAGAKGELDLKVISANSLRIDWHATEPGAEQGLDTGTAILTRRIE
jgi:curved DNA-binding protein CbpA